MELKHSNKIDPEVRISGLPFTSIILIVSLLLIIAFSGLLVGKLKPQPTVHLPFSKPLHALRQQHVRWVLQRGGRCESHRINGARRLSYGTGLTLRPDNVSPAKHPEPILHSIRGHRTVHATVSLPCIHELLPHNALCQRDLRLLLQSLPSQVHQLQARDQ